MPIESVSQLSLCRRVFYISDAILWVLGWTSLVVGIWLYIDRNTYAPLVPSNSYSAMSAAGLCISMGGMSLIIAFVGLIGAWTGTLRLLIAYFCFVGLLFVVQCIAAVTGYFHRDTVREKIKHTLYATINATAFTSPAAPANDVRVQLGLAWNQLQSELGCCGVESYTNWYYSAQWPKQRFVPDSCCDAAYFVKEAEAPVNCGKNEAKSALFAYQEGCFSPFTDWLLRHLFIVGLLALLFIIVESFALATALRLIWHLRSGCSSRLETCYRYSKDEQTLRTEGQSRLLEPEAKETPNEIC